MYQRDMVEESLDDHALLRRVDPPGSDLDPKLLITDGETVSYGNAFSPNVGQYVSVTHDQICWE
jgi:hypothetical protein